MVTAMPPALSTAYQQAASIGVLGARSSTRFPGSRPDLVDEHARDAVCRGEQLRVGPANAARRQEAARVFASARRARPAGSAAALRRCGILQFRQLEAQLRHLVARGQPLLGKRVRVAGEAQVAYALQDGFGDHDLLDLAGAFVDAQRANVAVEALDDLAARDSAAAEELHGAVADASRGFGCKPLRHRGLARHARRAAILAPRGAIDEQRCGVDDRSPCSRARLASAAARSAARRRAAAA